MEISKIKRGKAPPHEQYVSWKDGERKGTVLIGPHDNFEALSDADKEAYVMKKSGVSKSAPTEKVIETKSAPKAPVLDTVSASPIKPAT